MSRIGRMPVTIPAGVTVTVADGNVVTVKGPKGTLTETFSPILTIVQENGALTVSRPNDLKENRALHGLTRTLVSNMVIGVTEGFKKELDINGIGYRAAKQGKQIVLNVGYSHQVFVDETDDISLSWSIPTTSTWSAATSRRSARLPLRSVPSVRLSLIRARVSSTLTRSSAARKARPASSKK